MFTICSWINYNLIRNRIFMWTCYLTPGPQPGEELISNMDTTKHLIVKKTLFLTFLESDETWYRLISEQIWRILSNKSVLIFFLINVSCFKTPASNFETPTHDFPYQGSGVFFAVQSYEVNKGLAGTNFLSSNHRLSDPTHSFQAICEQKETIDKRKPTDSHQL